MRESSVKFSVRLPLLCLSAFLIWAGCLKAEPVAPIYPQSEPAEHEVSEMMRPYVKAFYSKDPVEKVLSFYEGRLGPFEEAREGQVYQNLFRRVRIEKADIQPSPIGVRIETKRPVEKDEEEEEVNTDDNGKKGEAEKIEIPVYGPCHSHEIFDHLRFLEAQLPEKGPEDFKSVCERFLSLTWSYFQITEKLDQRDRPMNKAQAMIAGHKEKEGSLEQVEDMGQEIARLMEEGRIAEAMALSAKIQDKLSGVIEPDEKKWDNYVKLLHEIEKHAFQTIIYIHREPPGK